MKRYTPSRKLRGKRVYYWHSASEVLGVTFVRWVRARMNDGRDNNKVAIGAIVYEPWMCGPPFNRKPPHGFKKGHFQLRPYWQIFRSSNAAWRHKRPINPPPVTRVKSGIFST